MKLTLRENCSLFIGMLSVLQNLESGDLLVYFQVSINNYNKLIGDLEICFVLIFSGVTFKQSIVF